MKLENINFNEPEKTSVYAERYLNDSKGDFGKYSEVDQKYDPQSKTPHIEVPFIFLESKDLTIFESSPTPELLAAIKKDNRYKFFWHPDTERIFTPNGYHVMQPTSSTRTMLDTETKAFYAKMDLDKKHFRFIRRLKRGSVEHSILVNDDLLEMFKNANAESIERFSILPESLGLVIDEGVHTDSGVIFRESKPFPLSEEKTVVLPYHSLYAEDPNAPNHKPLLVELCLRNSPKDPLGYFVENIIGPVQDAWVLLLNSRGLLPELHGQNALVEISDDLDVKRLVQRDFQGIYSDSKIRLENNLKEFDKHIVGSESGTTEKSQYSHVFDGMIGRYLFERLAKAFCKYFPSYSYETVCKEIKLRFLSIPGNRLDVFPETAYRFGSTADEQTGNDVVLKDTNLPPEFR
ncbi:MAG: hypothetical protein RLZZ308_459 [Candidatus Parcubacteria bacterium]|jgi:hypothetical protein